ncbi:MAG TPA: hypothetical protein VGM53_35945 [Streptosporangiaceae bacterium]|jgi:hypothetical protein
MTEHDAPPVVFTRSALTGAGNRTAPGWAVLLRLAAHVAAWLPFVIGTVRSAQRGLPAVGDGASIALRSWDTLTASGPLVGQATELHSGAFDAGPLQYWLLAIPVHMDPRHGLMWGAALCCIVAGSLAIEAARSALGALGGLVASGFILAIVAWQPLIAAHPFWNPWFGVIFFLAALAAALAVLSGRRRWWPVLVVTASVAAQAHLMFMLASAALVLVALVVALAGTIRARAGYWWAVIGLAAGAGCWAAPLIQQFTSPYPNISLLLNTLGKQQSSGPAFGFRAIAASSWHPLWLASSSSLDHEGIGSSIGGRSPAFGVAVLAATAVALILAVRPLRSRRLAALAAISLLTSGAVLATYSNVPVHNLGIATEDYLLVVLLPAGLLAWLTVGSAVVLAVRRAAGSARVAPARTPARGQPGSAGRSAARWGLAAVSGVAVALLGLGAWQVAARQVRMAPSMGSPTQAEEARYATAYIERMLPHQRVALTARTPGVGFARNVTLGVVWALTADGYEPVTNHSAARYLGPRYRYAGRPMPLVIVTLRQQGMAIHVTQASLSKLS